MTIIHSTEIAWKLDWESALNLVIPLEMPISIKVETLFLSGIKKVGTRPTQ
jgi:hypothetical protein